MLPTIRVGVRSMFASSELREWLRRVAAVLVEREEIRVRSRMVAYQNVGSQVGASAAWVRSLVNGYLSDTSDAPFSVALNLLALYDRLVERIELDNNEQAARIAALQREIYAAAPRALAEMAANNSGTPAAAAAPRITEDTDE